MGNIEFYSPWSKGLAYSKEALGILERAGFAGVTLWNLDDRIERIKNAGLGISLHVPGSKLTLNLASPKTVSAFNGEQGPRLMEAINIADDVSFHLGYAAIGILKDHRYQDLEIVGYSIEDKEFLADTFVRNLITIKDAINNGEQDKKIKIAIENLCLHRDMPELRRSTGSYLNAGKSFITEYDFFKYVLEESGVSYLPDAAHMIITANTMKHNGACAKEEEYIDAMTNLGDGDVFHTHINRPLGSRKYGYCDLHLPLKPDDYASDYVLELAKEMAGKNTDDHRFTLEMWTWSEPGRYLEPVEHAKTIAKQMEYVSRMLENLTCV
jgi:hypothetical protein